MFNKKKGIYKTMDWGNLDALVLFVLDAKNDIYLQNIYDMGYVVTMLRNESKINQDIIHFLRREMLDFTAFPVFFVSNLLLVQRKKYYFNRATVSRNCSIVL